MYQVFVEYDGCSNGPAVFVGLYKECLHFLRTRTAPKLCTFNLVNKETGRAVSYLL